MDLKLSYFCQKNYLKLGSFWEKRNQLPDPQLPAAGGFTSRPSKQPPSMQIPLNNSLQSGASPPDPPKASPHCKLLKSHQNKNN